MNRPDIAQIHRLISFGTILFVIILFGLLLAGRSRFFKDPGTFWHVRTGEIMIDTRTFLASDPYSFTFSRHRWTPFEWLGEIGMAMLFRAGGFELLLLAAATIIAGLYSWLGSRIARTGLHWAATLCLTGLAIAAAANHFHVRPHLLTALLMAVTMCHLMAVEAGRWSIRSLGLLIPVFVVWSNVHGGVMGGIATVGITFAGWLILFAMKYELPIRNVRDAIELCVIGLLILASPLVNPYGINLPKTWIAIMTMPEVKQVIVEHFPIDARDPANVPFFALGAIYLFLLCGLRQMPRATWLIPVMWFVLGCDRVRNASLFGIVALAAIADLFPQTRWAEWLAAKRPDFYVPVEASTPANRWSVVIPLLTVTLAISIFGRHWVRFDETRWPVPLIETMHREARGRTGINLFNEINLGGFVIGMTPEYRNFVDDRCELYGGAFLKAMEDANRGGADAREKYMGIWSDAFSYALTQRGTGFDDYFRSKSDEWMCVEMTDYFAFYRRR